MKKKTNNNRLPVPGKVKKGFRYYVTFVLTIALSGSLAMTAFAAGDDPLVGSVKMADHVVREMMGL